MNSWETLDYAALERLRDGFLSGAATRGPYWKTAHDLAAYDLTFGERIGWKWDAVLGEVRRRGWQPPAGPLFDWGCGSGVAGRRALAAWPGRFSELRLWDHSSLARDYAERQARSEFPGLRISIAPPASSPTPGTLVVSHVLNELSTAVREELLSVARRSDAILWVEPGTHASSRALIGVREALRESHRVVAPCTHSARCGLLAAGQEAHWCHHFARPPAEAFNSGDWAQWARRLGIDLRSLPYSFLILDRAGVVAPPEQDMARVVGDPRVYKGYAKLLSCEADGVEELTVQKRDLPELFKAMKQGEAGPLHRWIREKERVVGVKPAP